MRVAVFAKAPVAGQVKTRLAPLLGDEGAAALHAQLVRRALSTAVAAGIGAVELHCAPDERHELFARCAAQFGVDLVAQRGADLGARMRNAFERAFEQGHALVVIGTDCPGLDADDLRAARDALARAPAVLSPAEDGGYVLIGLVASVPGLFDGIDWGSSTVLAQTRRRFAQAGVQCAELRELWDLDRPEDYARLQAAGLMEGVRG